MKQILINSLLAMLSAAVLVYAGDYISLRYRIPGNREQFGTVQVERSYAVPMKDGKTEYMFDPPGPQTCVYSLFPHFGDPPCWYLSRHQRQVVNTGGAPPPRP